METLDLDIKDRRGINGQILGVFQVICQDLFIVLFDFHKLIQHLLIICKVPEFFQAGGVLFVILTDERRNHLGQTGIAVEQPAAEGNAVRLIGEFLRIQLVEIMQFIVL